MKKISVILGMVAILLYLPQSVSASTCVPTSSGTNWVEFANATSCTYTVPTYGTLTVQVWGGGASGGNANSSGGVASDPGTTGGSSSFNSTVIAGGGQLASGYNSGLSPASGGTASGGSPNVSGSPNSCTSSNCLNGYSGGNGGAGGDGGAGGTGAYAFTGSYPYYGNPYPYEGGGNATAPGGGGGGACQINYYCDADDNCSDTPYCYPGGGGGAYATKAYTSGLTTGSGVTVVVGAGGASSYSGREGHGGNGQVTISWTAGSPSCSVTFNPASPIAYGATTTLNWTSSNASDVYINSYGYTTTANGYTTVGPLASTDYSCSAGNGTSTSTSPATLSVGPSAGISQSAISSYTTTPYSITSTSSNATACTTYAKLPGGATTTEWTGTSVTNSTTTSVVGTTTWWNSCSNATSLTSTSIILSHTVANASCTLNGVTVQSGQSYNFYSTQSAPQGQLCPAYSEKKTCANGVLSPSDSTYIYASCSCQQYDICTGSGNQTITQINADCSETPQTPACVSPQYCQRGASICQSPAIPSGPYQNGTHMELIPNLLQSGETTQVHWSVEDAQSCTVVGSNNDGTSGSSDTSSPGVWNTESGTKTSSPITAQTIYTLSCTAYGSNPGVSESQVVNVVPTYEEK